MLEIHLAVLKAQRPEGLVAGGAKTRPAVIGRAFMVIGMCGRRKRQGESGAYRKAGKGAFHYSIVAEAEAVINQSLNPAVSGSYPNPV
jgi:hypothetical protein